MRVARKKLYDGHIDIPFALLKKGDVFQLVEENGEIFVNQRGQSTFIAGSNAYKREDGEWTVSISTV